MRNVIIGLVVVGFLVGGVWYFSQDSDNSNLTTNGEVVECPVMGTKFPASRAYGKTEYKGKTYYFCCAGCPGAFEKNPGKYVK